MSSATREVTAIKFCGIRDPASIELAASLGVNAVGFVLYPPSPRAVTVEQLRVLQLEVPPFVVRVGLMVNPNADMVKRLIDEHIIDVIQFHGEESGDFCEGFGFPYVKALPAIPAVRQTHYWTQCLSTYPCARAFLLDTPHPTLRGGTGRCFDWSDWPKQIDRPLILSGGLTVENVAGAIARTHPYAVDVSSGIEREPGEKCRKRMIDFVASVRSGAAGEG
ncbi:MAG: phosphoribosylanthranilate isomerase [Gammaproteobacteria bacterium]